MFSHYLLLVLRTARSHKLFAAVMLGSLVTSFTCGNLLLSFLHFEKSTDVHHEKSLSTFQLFSDDPFGGEGRIPYLPGSFREYVTQYPEIDAFCQVSPVPGMTIRQAAGARLTPNAIAVDTGFFSLFDYPVIDGERRAPRPGEIVLSAEMAHSVFGEVRVAGKHVELGIGDTTFLSTVAAVIDIREHPSHLSFDAMLNHGAPGVQSGGGATYISMNHAGAAAPLAAKINADPARPGLLGPGKTTYYAQPLTTSYFTSANRMPFMRTRSELLMQAAAVATVLVLGIGVVNFLNLFMLFSNERRRTTGIRKTLGAARTQLLMASATESTIYIGVAFTVALLLTPPLLPHFNAVTRSSIPQAYWFNGAVLGWYAVILVTLTFAVALVLAVRQWRTKPVNLISSAVSKPVFNRYLFVAQYAISSVLIVSSVVVVRQMRYVEEADPGFNRNVIQITASPPVLPALKAEVLRMPGVTAAALGNGNPVSGNAMVRYDLDGDEYYTPYLFSGDEDFLKTLGLKLKEGAWPAVNSGGRLVNEAFVRYFSLSEPVGAKIPGTDQTISGVVADFTIKSFKQSIPPVIIQHSENLNSLLLAYSAKAGTILPGLEAVWKAVAPDEPFVYKVLADDLHNNYREERFFSNLILISAVISISLSAFGLFALSWAITQSRVREIGIRKVLGATVPDILLLLTKTFSRPMIVAFLIGLFPAYKLMDGWLQEFVNRITLGPLVFLAAFAVMALAGVLAVSVQTIRAATTDPVRELRR